VKGREGKAYHKKLSDLSSLVERRRRDVRQTRDSFSKETNLTS
jgi:hypothetical protein